MDVTTAAFILASGQQPTLSNLQDQQFKRMAADYKRDHAGVEVPVTRFSESVYEARLRDDAALPTGSFCLDPRDGGAQNGVGATRP